MELLLMDYMDYLYWDDRYYGLLLKIAKTPLKSLLNGA